MKNFKRVLSLALAALMVIGGLVIAPVDAKAANDYTKVTSVEDITAGGNFVLVAENAGAYYALGTTISGKIDATAVTVTNGELSGDNIPVWTIAATTNGVSLSNGTAYLSYNSGTNFTSATDTSSDKAEWTVTLGTDNAFRFTNVNSATRGIAYQYESSGTTYSRYGAYAISNDPLTKGEATGYVFGLSVYKYSGTVEVKEDITLDADATPEEIVNAAYQAKEDGVALLGTHTLEGVIVSIDTAYSEQYGNITVTMVVGDMEDKPIQCYRLTGTGIENLAVGDTIEVNGSLSYYNSKVQYASGSTLVSYEKGEIENTLPADATPEQIVNAAYDAMNNNTTMIGTYTLEGVITSIDTPYSESYGNITVTMVVGDMTDKPIQCYRLSGTGADGLEVGDTITVEGTLSYYNSKVQFAQGCALKSVEKGELEDTLPADATAEEIVDAAYDAMNNNTPMIGEYELTGVITSIDTEYSEQYGNITVTMVVDGMEDKPIQCYRLSGTGVENLKVGDTITVNGTFGSYNGKVQYNQGSTLESYVSAEGIPAKGDMAMPVALILFAGCALIAVAVVSKRKMA